MHSQNTVAQKHDLISVNSQNLTERNMIYISRLINLCSQGSTITIKYSRIGYNKVLFFKSISLKLSDFKLKSVGVFMILEFLTYIWNETTTR